MTENNKVEGKTWESFQALIEKFRDIKYGEWEVILFIHKGECTGFDELKPAKIKFRVKKT